MKWKSVRRKLNLLTTALMASTERWNRQTKEIPTISVSQDYKINSSSDKT